MSDKALHKDKELLARIAEGDEQAFETLYRRYRNKAYSITLTYITVPSQAEDILQELFLTLWEKKETLPQIESFDHYLFIMLRNRLVTELRKKERQERIKQYSSQTHIQQSTPDQQTEANEANRIIQEALLQLPEKQQRIYRMSREEGLNHEEIGAILDISPRTVSNNISFALNHLRAVLDQHGYLVIDIVVLTPVLFQLI